MTFITTIHNEKGQHKWSVYLIIKALELFRYFKYLELFIILQEPKTPMIHSRVILKNT